MPYEVEASHIKVDHEVFHKAVADHIEALHAFHKTVNVPRPTAHHLVEACITRVVREGHQDQYVADYAIVDNEPKPEVIEPTLEEKKHALQCQVAALEQVAKDKVLPRRKLPLAALRYQYATAKKEDKRTSEEVETIVEYQNIQRRLEELNLMLAQGFHDIEDLTEETIASWQPPDFDKA